MEILTNFPHVVGKFVITENYIVMVICLFGKGVTKVILMPWIIIKSRFNYDFFTLFGNFQLFTPMYVVVASGRIST